MNNTLNSRNLSCNENCKKVRNGWRKTGIVAICMLIGLPFFAWYGEWYGEWDQVDFTYEYDWINEPPLDSEKDSVFMSWVCYNKDLKLKKSNQNVSLLIKDDSIYLPILKIYDPLKWEDDGRENDYKKFASFRGWIKGIVKGNEVIFRDNDTIGSLKTTIRCSATYTDSINESSITESICMWGASEFGPRQWKDEGSDVGSYTSCGVSFDLTDADVSATIARDKSLISNFSSGFMVSTQRRSGMSWRWSEYYQAYRTFNTQAIPGLIVGKVSKETPDSLPLPEVATRFRTRYQHFHGGHVWTIYYPQLDIQMNIVNADSTLMDQSNIYIKFWVDDQEYGPFSFASHGNPFSQHCVYGFELPSFEEWSYDPDPEWRPWIRGYCYYKTDDGRQIQSPEFSLNKPSEMHDIGIITDRGCVQDFKIYDLTGREMKEGELAPGIYIRNGRKFAVGR